MQTERRGYFRIQDEIILSCQGISDDVKQVGMKRLQSQEAPYPDNHHLYLSLEADCQELLKRLSKEDTTTQLLRLFNRKINLLAKTSTLNAKTESLLDKPKQSVNLSATGLSFVSEIPLRTGQAVLLEMILPPGFAYILAYGSVVVCEPKNSAYRIAVDIQCMREQDTEKLIQHIMRKEVQLLKEKRLMRST